MKKIIVMMIGLFGCSFSLMHSMDHYLNEFKEEFDVVVGVNASITNKKGNIYWERTPRTYEARDQRLAQCTTFEGTTKMMRENLLYQQVRHVLNNIKTPETEIEHVLTSYERGRGRDSIVKELDANTANIEEYSLLIGARMEQGSNKNIFDGKLIMSAKEDVDVLPIVKQGHAIAKKLETEFGIPSVEVIVLR